MKKKSLQLIGFFVLFTLVFMKSQTLEAQNSTANNQQTTVKENVICIKRSELQKYSPGLLSDLEKKYGATLSVNPNMGILEQSTLRKMVNKIRFALSSGLDRTITTTTNETEKFANTGLGKLVIFLIVWHTLSASIPLIFIVLPLFFVLMFFLRKIWRRECVPHIKEKSRNEHDEGVIVEYEVEDANWILQLLYGIILLVLCWVCVGVF
jgi:hypothetical protein